MTTATVTNICKDSLGKPVVGETVTAWLNQPAFDSTGQFEIIRYGTATTDNTGAYSLSLTLNSELTPTGTYYTITEPGGIQWTVQVNAAGTFWINSVLVTPPASAASAIGSVRYDVSQPLTSAQQAQARANIGAGSGGGSGTVSSVNSIAPDGTGNVTLTASNVGADASGAAATAQTNAQNYADTNKLAKSANLSDVAVPATARTNLGLGTAATQNKVAAGSAGVLDATDPSTTNSRTPSGSASGDLSGSYPSPTVAKINGTALSGLATGVLKNTTTTGVPSIAVAADIPTVAAGSTGPLSATDATTTNSRTPTGTAGGDLTGTYPNPTLAATAVTAGSYTSANITVDAKGRVTAAANGTGGGIPASTVTAKGDIIAATASATVTNVPVGSNGYVVTADSTQSAGLRYAPNPSALAPSGLWIFLNQPNNGVLTPTKNQELAIGFLLGPQTISQLAFQIMNTPDAGAVVRLGIRADSGGKPGAPQVDNPVTVTANAWNAVTVTYAHPGGILWVTLTSQNWTTTGPQVQVTQAQQNTGVQIGTGAALSTLGWATGHGPGIGGQTGVTGALPGTFTNTINSNTNVPVIAAKGA